MVQVCDREIDMSYYVNQTDTKQHIDLTTDEFLDGLYLDLSWTIGEAYGRRSTIRDVSNISADVL